MSFLCPICRTPTLQTSHLEPELATECCTQCEGHWVTSARYFSYLSISPEVTTPVRAPEPHADSPALKLCPTCSKFMHYYPVGHELPFGIDKCNTCGGVWLNAGEWESLKLRNFHNHLHAISSDAWQTQVHHQIRAAQEEMATEKRLGQPDYQRLLQVASRIRPHPHRAELLAYLQRAARES